MKYFTSIFDWERTCDIQITSNDSLKKAFVCISLGQ